MNPWVVKGIMFRIRWKIGYQRPPLICSRLMLPGQVVRLKELFHYQIGSLEVVVFFLLQVISQAELKVKKKTKRLLVKLLTIYIWYGDLENENLIWTYLGGAKHIGLTTFMFNKSTYLYWPKLLMEKSVQNYS